MDDFTGLDTNYLTFALYNQLQTMRQFIVLFMSLIIFTSCSNDKKTPSEVGSIQIDSLKQKFIPTMNGAWVLTDYIEAIEQSKSPLNASVKLQGVVTMIIDADMKSDSINVGASWNNHEGYNFSIYLLPGQHPNCLKTNLSDYDEQSSYYELGYEKSGKKTSLVLYQYNKMNKLIDKKKFTKVADKQQDNDAALGLQHIVNEKLFSGNYLLIDSMNLKKKVTFKSDGSLAGFPNFKTYVVNTDFMGGPETQLDGIALNVDEKNSKWFAFKINGDTTFLFSTIGNEEAGKPLQLDKIHYKLVRQ